GIARAFDLRRENLELAREASVFAAFLTSGPGHASFTTWVTAMSAEARFRAEFTSTAVPAEQRAFQHAIGNIDTSALGRSNGASTGLPEVFPAPAQSPSQYVDAYRSRSAVLRRGIAAVDRTVSDGSAARASTARHEVWLYGGAAVIAMFLTLALMWFVV